MAAALVNLDRATVRGTGVEVLSEGKTYTLVFHPGSKIAKIQPGIYDHLEMSYAPRVGWWHKMSLDMSTSGKHTWTIVGRSQADDVITSWKQSFVIPNWYKGHATDVNFYA